MAKATTVKLEAGSPLYGTVKFVDYYPQKPDPKDANKTMAAQWGLTGQWDNGDAAEEGRVYIDTWQLEQNPVQQGLVLQDGNWPDGNPKFKWIGKGTVTLTKWLKDKKAHVRITADGGAVPALAGNAANIATPSPAPTPDLDERWGALERTYAKCAQVANKVWPNMIDNAIVAATATVFIEANKHGLTVPGPGCAKGLAMAEKMQQAEAIRDGLDSYAGMPHQLKEKVPVGDVPDWMK